MEPNLRLRPSQRRLMREQEAEVPRFAEAYFQTQLSTEPIDEAKAAALLKQAYEIAGLAAPQHIHWLDGPLQLLAIRVPAGVWDRVHQAPVIRDGLWEAIESSALESVWDKVQFDVQKRVEASIRSSFPNSRRGRAWNRENVYDSVQYLVQRCFWASFWGNARANVRSLLWTNIEDSFNSIQDSDQRKIARRSTEASIRAYEDRADLACYSFFHTYLAPNDLHALAQFNQMVSGYWLGKEVALIVRRPKRLCLDEAGRLHSNTAMAIEYPDGWGCYVWHGVQVPKKVILTPEALAREDFLRERNIEVRRVIQERLGQRFVWELEGKFIDGGPQGVLYEVPLPGDPERVARYVHVQDASTPHQYYLRVPPTIQTVDEALAWSFGMTVEDYHPAQET